MEVTIIWGRPSSQDNSGTLSIIQPPPTVNPWSSRVFLSLQNLPKISDTHASVGWEDLRFSIRAGNWISWKKSARFVSWEICGCQLCGRPALLYLLLSALFLLNLDQDHASCLCFVFVFVLSALFLNLDQNHASYPVSLFSLYLSLSSSVSLSLCCPPYFCRIQSKIMQAVTEISPNVHSSGVSALSLSFAPIIMQIVANSQLKSFKLPDSA